MFDGVLHRLEAREVHGGLDGLGEAADPVADDRGPNRGRRRRLPQCGVESLTREQVRVGLVGERPDLVDRDLDLLSELVELDGVVRGVAVEAFGEQSQV